MSVRDAQGTKHSIVVLSLSDFFLFLLRLHLLSAAVPPESCFTRMCEPHPGPRDPPQRRSYCFPPSSRHTEAEGESPTPSP